MINNLKPFVAAATTALALNAHAVDMFLDIEGPITGESTDPNHKGQIDVLAWSWGLSNSGSLHTGGATGGGNANFQDISVTKYVDTSSPDLMLHVANGASIPGATLVVRKAAGTKAGIEYITIEMKNVLVTSASTGGSGGEDKLTENITLNFAEVCVKYVPETSPGVPGPEESFCWDIPNNNVP